MLKRQGIGIRFEVFTVISAPKSSWTISHIEADLKMNVK
jgi:hypothetical protein